MADNLAVTAGSGSTIGMDEVVDGTLGTVKVGFGKIMDGTLDGTDKLKITTQNAAQVAGDTAHDAVDAGNPVKIGGKARSSAPADVTLTGDRVDAYFDMKGRLKVDGSDVTQPVSGTVTANLAAGTNNIGDVDVLTLPVAFNTGLRSATTQRVTVATDDLVPVSAASLPLPAGAATSALQTQPGVDIGDVTINNAAGAAAVNIQDGGNSITVDGAVTTSGTVTEANSAAILTSTQLLDDTVATLGTTTYTEAATKGNVIGAVRRDANTTLVDTTNEVAPLQVNATGELKVAQIQALPAGTNNIGDVDVLTLPALPAGTNNIGDVDVLTVNGVAPAFGTGVRGATVQRVTLATDDVIGITANSSVNAAQINGVAPLMGNGVSGTGVLRVAQVSDGTGTLATVTSLTQMNGQAISMGTGVRAAGTQRVTIATDDVVPASQSGTWTVQPGNTANSTPWLVTDTGSTTGGLSKFHLVGAATTNATNIKASAGQVYSITAFNVAATPIYLKFHNTAGTPTAGAAVTDTFLIPGNTAGAGMVLNIDKGIAFATGIAITTVTDIADAGTTAIAASSLVLNVYYK